MIPQIALLQSLKYLKPVIIVLFTIISLALVYYEGYTSGVKKYNRESEIAALELKIKQKNEEAAIHKLQLEETKKELELEKKNIKVVTEYKTKQVVIEKEKPVYEQKIKKVFVNKPTEYVDPELVRLHDDYVCSNQIEGSSSKCGTSRETEKPVTAEQFTRQVMENYSIAFENNNKLVALQEQIKNQQEINDDSNGTY